LQQRIDDPRQRSKFRSSDLLQSTHWTEYQRGNAEMPGSTSTDQAPWSLVPASRNWHCDLVVAEGAGDGARQAAHPLAEE
jgi:polyphosphate kinase 2 (PPK2 family)